MMSSSLKEYMQAFDMEQLVQSSWRYRECHLEVMLEILCAVEKNRRKIHQIKAMKGISLLKIRRLL